MGFVVKKTGDGNKVNIKLVRGDTIVQNVKIYTEDLLRYVPSENDTITFAIFRTFKDESPLLSKVLDYENPTFSLTAEESQAFPYGSYVYSVKIEFEGGTVDTFLSGKFDIVQAGEDV